MDNQTLLLLRLMGYLLNAALFVATAFKFRHHFLVLGAWSVWMLVVMIAILYQLQGDANVYSDIVTYGVMVLLYVNAILGAWVLITYEPKRNKKK